MVDNNRYPKYTVPSMDRQPEVLPTHPLTRVQRAFRASVFKGMD